jgi:hypothetical protein
MQKLLLVILFPLYSFISYGQTIADFESNVTAPSLSPNGAIITTNPDKAGDPSDKVAFYKKAAGNWQAIYITFPLKKNIGSQDRLTFKIRSSTKGRVFVKVVDGSNVLREDWGPDYNFQPETNQWTTCTLDISSLKDQQFDQLQINASVDNTLEANVYLDDFKLINSLSPNGEPILKTIISSEKITEGESINFDASTSTDDGTIDSFLWNFGDGLTGTSDVEDHVYAGDGIYFPTVTLTDNDGNKSFKKFSIVVLPQSGKLSRISFTLPSPKLYEKIEGVFAITTTPSNVYDPEIISIDALITLPDLTVMRVPCFYYQASHYQSAIDRWVNDQTTGFWMLRFSSSQIGSHNIKLELTDVNGITSGEEQSVIINEGTTKGYLRLDAVNMQHYRHTTGEPFFPLGINVAWNTTPLYSKTFSNLSDGKANFVRYWQVPFNRQALEWRNGYGFYKGLGIYSQEAAAEQDSILELCAKYDLYAQLTLFQHGMFSENVDSNWSDNPYNSANGGPLNKAEQYFYNTTTKNLTKKLLRYIVARWGYSTNIFAWELFNEVNFTGNFPNQSAQWYPGVLQWHDEMGQYIKSIDPFKHIVTTSSDENNLPDMDKLEGLDIVQYHLYNANLLSTQAAKDKSILAKLSNTGLINGEYGENVSTADVPFDAQRISIWSGIMSRVPHIMWKWENYTDKTWTDLFKHPAEFLQGEDFTAQGELTDWIFDAKSGATKLSTIGFHSDEKFYGLIYDPSYKDNVSGVACDLSALAAGNYKITYYDIVTGEVTTEEKTIYVGLSQLTVPTFSKGVAMKIEFISDAPITELETNASEFFTVYPNPVKENLFIRFSGISSDIQITILNMTGEELVTVNYPPGAVEDNKISISLAENNLNAGMYFIKIKTNDGSSVRKIAYALH